MSLNPDDFFIVYRLRHSPDGRMVRQQAGRFAFLPGEIAVLEDYFGMLEGLDGPPDENKQKLIRSLMNSAYVDVVRQGDLRDGSRPDLLPEVVPPNNSANGNGSAVASPGGITQPAVWDYHRPGMETPQCLEFHHGSSKALLNGQALTEWVRDLLARELDESGAS